MRTTTLRLAILAGVLIGDAMGQEPGKAARRRAPAATGRAGRSRLPANWSRLREPKGLWLGQDGVDVVGPSSVAAPSDVQDIHIALGGLPAGVEVTSGVVTGLGGDEWRINGPFGPWKAALERKANATVADLYLEPSRAETGRPFNVRLEFADGRIAEVTVAGGKADPNLRMPNAALALEWIGQDRQDRVGPGPGVGPDGLQDARLALAKLSPGVEIKAVTLKIEGGRTFQTGVNPEGLDTAELIRRGDDPTRADLFFQPPGGLEGKSIALRVEYANSKSDAQTLKAGRYDPKLRMPRAEAPRVEPIALRARWLGQDGSGGLGDVHLEVDGLPHDRPVVAAALSDPVRGCWIYRANEGAPFHVDPILAPLAFKAVGSKADLHFAPDRDEAGATLTLRLVFADGRASVAQFEGGPCDIARRAKGIGPGSAVAKSGDDVQAMVNRSGTVKLARGTYEFDRPLVLERPVTLTAEPGTILRFQQKPGDPTWTSAIKIHCGNTTLENFAVRFAGPIRWTPDTHYGPAVIGTTDNHDQGHHDLKVGITLRNLDLEAPPAASKWEEAPRLIRMGTAQSGLIEKNVLKGGITEILYGPWQILGNDYRGTVPNTFAYAVFSAHHTHDLIVRGNEARPVGPSGKTWRFLVLTGAGANDVIEGNTVVEIGPRDDDKVPADNAPEIVLTEAYSLHFEGKPAAISADGRVLRVPGLQGDQPRTGAVVAILNGPHAGDWRKIAQAIDPHTYLLESPLPSGVDLVSIATGFVNETFRGNTIDARGSSVAVDLDLVGNHFGTRVLNNRLLGAGAFRIAAAPSERPVHWGWSHAPMFGIEVTGNTIEDSAHGGTLSVEHGPTIKSSRGRVYLSAKLKDTTVKWSPGFVAGRSKSGRPEALTIGEPGALDPGELRVSTGGNRAEATPGARPTLLIRGATVDGKAVAEKAVALPARR